MTMSGDTEVESGNDRIGYKPLSPHESSINWEGNDSISNADMEKLTINIEKIEFTQKKGKDMGLKSKEAELVEILISEVGVKI